MNQGGSENSNTPGASRQQAGSDGYKIEVVCRAGSNDQEINAPPPAPQPVTIQQTPLPTPPGPLKSIAYKMLGRHTSNTVHPFPIADRLAGGRSTSSSFGVPNKKTSIASINVHADAEAKVVSQSAQQQGGKKSFSNIEASRVSSVFDSLGQQKKNKQPWKRKAAMIMDSVPYTFVTLTLTLMVRLIFVGYSVENLLRKKYTDL